MKTLLSLIVVGLLVAGCGGGPDTATLEKEIQENLDSQFKPGLLKVSTMKRMGSAPSNTGGGKVVLVYYNSQLEFLEDHNLTSWEDLNVGALAQVLGATEKGIKGVKSQGNKTGDILQVHGRATYIGENGGWKQAASGRGGQFAGAPDLENTSPRSNAERLIQEIGEAAKTSATGLRGVETKIVEEELTTALRNINLRIDKTEGTASLLSGESLGEYFRIGKAIEGLGETAVRNYASAGSVENAGLVQTRTVDLALVQNDIAVMAYTGEGVFAGREPMENLRALASLFPEPIQFVTLATSEIKTIADLKGRRVDIGLPNSGSRVNAVLVLEAHGITLSDLQEVSGVGMEESVAMIKAGELDAFAVTVAAPATHLQDLAASTHIRVLSMNADARNTLSRDNPYYIPVTLPARIYNGQEEPVDTLSVTAMLIAHKDVSKDEVEKLLQSIFDDVEQIFQAGSGATLIDRTKANEGVAIPLHPGAEAYFSSS